MNTNDPQFSNERNDSPNTDEESLTEPVVSEDSNNSNDSKNIHISGEGYTFRWKRPQDPDGSNSEYVPLGEQSRVIDLRATFDSRTDDDIEDEERDSA